MVQETVQKEKQAIRKLTERQPARKQQTGADISDDDKGIDAGRFDGNDSVCGLSCFFQYSLSGNDHIYDSFLFSGIFKARYRAVLYPVFRDSSSVEWDHDLEHCLSGDFSILRTGVFMCQRFFQRPSAAYLHYGRCIFFSDRTVGRSAVFAFQSNGNFILCADGNQDIFDTGVFDIHRYAISV